MRRIYSWLGVAFVSLLVACGGGSEDAAVPAGIGASVTLDASRAVSDSIGSEGGVLVATASSGITYTLTIPPGALPVPTKITLTPIKDQQHLPVSGGFAAGADFQPAGLQFAQPVRFSATPLPAPAAGMQLIAITFEGDGNALGLAPLANGNGTSTTLLTHFSGASFVFGTTADLELLARQAAPGVASQAFLNQLSGLGPIASPGNPAALPILKAWFRSVVLPELQGAGTDAELLLAIGDYAQWHLAAAVYLQGQFPIQPLFPQPDTPVPGLLAEEGQGSQAAAPTLRNAISGNNAVCVAQRSLQALSNVLYWQRHAQYFGVDTPAEHLDQATVLARICAKVVEVSHSLTNPLQVGFPHTLEVTFGLLFGNDVTPTVELFGVTVSATGATVQNRSGFTNAAGLWGGSVITAQSSDVTIAAQGCLLNLNHVAATILCGTANIQNSGVNLTGLWSGDIDGIPVDLTISQNQNAVTGTYASPTATFNVQQLAGTISGTLSGGTLLNFSFNQTSQGQRPCVGTFSGVPQASSMAITGTATGTDCAGRSRDDTFLFVPVTTGFSVAGIYFTHQCNGALICVAGVFQYGNKLFIDADVVYRATITGTQYAGVGTLPGCSPHTPCVADPTRTITGSFGGAGLSGTVVGPTLGTVSFSLPKFP